jgi:hypothetical protein
MTAEPSGWAAYVGAVIRIEAPGGVVWAVAPGAEFGQDAIFVLTPGDRRVVGCTGKRVVTTGWSIEPTLERAQRGLARGARDDGHRDGL